MVPVNATVSTPGDTVASTTTGRKMISGADAPGLETTTGSRVVTAVAAIALFVAASAAGSVTGADEATGGVKRIATHAINPIIPYVPARAATSFNPSASE
jgi:hypothetical protein